MVGARIGSGRLSLRRGARRPGADGAAGRGGERAARVGAVALARNGPADQAVVRTAALLLITLALPLGAATAVGATPAAIRVADAGGAVVDARVNGHSPPRPTAGARVSGRAVAGAGVVLSAARSRSARKAAAARELSWRLVAAPEGSRYHRHPGVRTTAGGCPAHRAAPPPSRSARHRRLGRAFRQSEVVAREAQAQAAHAPLRGVTRTRGARTTFIPDVPGCYAVRLRSRALPSRSRTGHPRGQAASQAASVDTVTLNAGPALLRVPVRLMAPESPTPGAAMGIRVGGAFYPAEEIAYIGPDEATPWLQVLALDRATLQPIASFARAHESTTASIQGPGNATYNCGPGHDCQADLQSDLAALPAGTLVIVVSQPWAFALNTSGQPPSTASLSPIGVTASLPAWAGSDTNGGNVWAAGVTGADPGSGILYASRGAMGETGTRAALQVGTDGAYRLLATDPVTIDTCATCTGQQPDTQATSNTIEVGPPPAGGVATDYTQSLPAEATGGFQLLALDAYSLDPLFDEVVQTNPAPAPGTLSGVVGALQSAVAGSEYVLVVQSIGSPADQAYAATDGWNALAGLAAQSGGTAHAVLAMPGLGPAASPAQTGQSGQVYALIGGSAFSEPGTAPEAGSGLAEALNTQAQLASGSAPAQPLVSTGQLTGALTRRGQTWAYRASAGELPTPNADLLQVLDQPPAGTTSPLPSVGGLAPPSTTIGPDGWPTADPATMAWFVTALNAQGDTSYFAGEDVRIPEYHQLSPSVWTGANSPLDALGSIGCPATAPPGFPTAGFPGATWSRTDCQALWRQLRLEFTWQSASATYLSTLAAPILDSESTAYVDVDKVITDIAYDFQVASSGAQVGDGWLKILDDGLGIASSIPGSNLGAAVNPFTLSRWVLGIGLDLSDVGGSAPGSPELFETTAASYASDMSQSMDSAFETLTSVLPQTIGSDYGRLWTVGTLGLCGGPPPWPYPGSELQCTPAWSLDDVPDDGPPSAALSQALETWAVRGAYEHLLPAAYPPVGATHWWWYGSIQPPNYPPGVFDHSDPGSFTCDNQPDFSPPAVNRTVARWSITPTAGPYHDMFMPVDFANSSSQPSATLMGQMYGPLDLDDPASGAGIAGYRLYAGPYGQGAIPVEADCERG